MKVYEFHRIYNAEGKKIFDSDDYNDGSSQIAESPLIYERMMTKEFMKYNETSLDDSMYRVLKDLKRGQAIKTTKNIRLSDLRKINPELKRRIVARQCYVFFGESTKIF